MSEGQATKSPIHYSSLDWPNCLSGTGDETAQVHFQSRMPLVDCYKVVIADLFYQSQQSNNQQLAKIAQEIATVTNIPLISDSSEVKPNS